MGSYQLPSANALDVADQVRVQLDSLSERFPADMRYSILYDTTRYVRISIREVIVTLFQAIALVVLVVFVFLGDWRATLVPGIAVPVSLIGTFAVLLMAGFSINTIVLFALILAIGIVVDDAIVVVENTQRHIADGKTPVEATRLAMHEVAGPVIATTLVLLAVFVPVAMIPGITGELCPVGRYRACIGREGRLRGRRDVASFASRSRPCTSAPAARLGGDLRAPARRAEGCP